MLISWLRVGSERKISGPTSTFRVFLINLHKVWGIIERSAITVSFLKRPAIFRPASSAALGNMSLFLLMTVTIFFWTSGSVGASVFFYIWWFWNNIDQSLKKFCPLFLSWSCSISTALLSCRHLQKCCRLTTKIANNKQSIFIRIILSIFDHGILINASVVGWVGQTVTI